MEYDSMRWRCIGPHRGGRTVGAAGIPGKPNTFFIGVNNGGVWKTTDAGRVWKPIFDTQPTGSIGNLAVAPSNPETIYVASGEGLQRPDLSIGDGIYRTNDGGKTWKNLGLNNALQIPGIVVDPKNETRVFVAALGHPYGPNIERGIFRTTNGGESWQKVLYIDENTGAFAIEFDPSNSDTLLAAMWAGRQGPWENGQWEGKTSGLFKTTDGGEHWTKLTKGLPANVGRIGVSYCKRFPKQVYAIVDASSGGGIYRSQDGGESWKLTSSEGRLWGRGSDFGEVRVDPTNPEVVYSANTSCYKSVDGGKSWKSWKGAPGGDDYHTVWINPDHPETILLASDQGATITVNGGETWSSWYNQPTAQLYHVSTDNQIPYWVYGGQQESGSVGISSRGNDGQITFREWHPSGGDEYAYLAPDPLNFRYIYGGRVNRYDKVTGLVKDIRPKTPHRTLRTAPLHFSPIDKKTLYFGANLLFKTNDGGDTWETISPDLSREKYEVHPSVGIYSSPAMATMPRRGVIYSLGLSPLDQNIIWAGTDDGLVHVTRDGGKTWANVTPPQMNSWSKVSSIDASHFDVGRAYISVNRIRLDDLKAYVWKTSDFGKTWQLVTTGLPDSPLNVVREDSVRKGLLFCGSETSVWFSASDGASWSPLRLNMPATSIRDLVVKNEDLVVGTHGRSFWILDDISPLRELGTGLEFALTKPRGTYRFERNTNTDTPLPPEEPAGKNPPDGAIIYFTLPSQVREVKLEILDQKGATVRVFRSSDKADPVDENTLTVPSYWIRPHQPLRTSAGSHRFVWDLHGEPGGAGRRGYPISAIFQDTPGGQGPMVPAGTYQVRLTADGKVLSKAFRILPDPRI